MEASFDSDRIMRAGEVCGKFLLITHQANHKKSYYFCFQQKHLFLGVDTMDTLRVLSVKHG